MAANIVSVPTILLFLLITSIRASSTQSPITHVIRDIFTNCQRAVDQLLIASGNQTLDEYEFFEYTNAILKHYPAITFIDKNHFQMQITNEHGRLYERYGSCSVPYLNASLICLFKMGPEGVQSIVHYLDPNSKLNDCLLLEKQMSQRISVWEKQGKFYSILDFGPNCCVYDPQGHKNKSETVGGGESDLKNHIPLVVIGVSVAVLVGFVAIYFMAGKQKRKTRKITRVQVREKRF